MSQPFSHSLSNQHSRPRQSFPPSPQRALADLRAARELRLVRELRLEDIERKAEAGHERERRVLAELDALLESDPLEESGEFDAFVVADTIVSARARAEADPLHEVDDGDSTVMARTIPLREVIESVDDADVEVIAPLDTADLEAIEPIADADVVYLSSHAELERFDTTPAFPAVPFELVTRRDETEDEPVAVRLVSRRRLRGARLLFAVMFGGVLGLLAYEGTVAHRAGSPLLSLPAHGPIAHLVDRYFRL
jgi:hypothetical protein